MKLFLKCFKKCLPLGLLVIALFVYPYMIKSDAGSIDTPLEVHDVAPEMQGTDENESEWYREMLAACPNNVDSEFREYL